MHPLTTGKRLVLAGGGHAHLTTLKRLRDFTTRGYRVTLISPSEYHYYSGMGPGMLAGTYSPREIRFDIRNMAESAGGYFLQDSVKSIDPKSRVLLLNSGQGISYDVVSFNTGSTVPLDTIAIEDTANVFAVKPIENLFSARQAIIGTTGKSAPHLLIAGGGNAGFEVSGNAWRLLKDIQSPGEITLLAGRRFLPSVPEKVRKLAAASLNERRIRIIEGPRLTRLGKNFALLDDRQRIFYDIVFLATGVRPSGIFKDSGLPTSSDGGLLVNAFLQCAAYSEIFGGGDCISFQDSPLAKVGVYPVRQSPVLHHNLMAALEGSKLLPFDPGGDYLLILNFGDGRGVLYKNRLVLNGRIAFFVKEHIDRKFMKRFQISGETLDPQ